MAHKQPRRTFTPQEIAQIEGFSAIRVPLEQIAALFGMSDTWFNELVRNDEAAQLALRQGRAKASAKFRETLYSKAIKGDIQAMKFWGATQEGFKTTETIELTGLNGSALNTLTTEEIKAKIAGIIKKRKQAEE